MERIFEGMNDSKYYFSVYLMYPRYAFWLKFQRKAWLLFACPGILFIFSALAFALVEGKGKTVCFWIMVALGCLCFALIILYLVLVIYFYFKTNPMPCKKGQRYVLYGDLDNEAIVSESDDGQKSIKVFHIYYSQFYIAISETEGKVLLVPNDESIMRYLKDRYPSRFLDMPGVI